MKNLTEFARVPLLNPEQLVVAWREVLPKTREPEARRIPLELKGTGIYLVEAVADRLRAYTIVAMSDLGLLTKTAPGQVFSWTVNRASGKAQAACDVAALVDGQRRSSRATDEEGVALLDLEVEEPRAALALARCGTEVAVADLGGFYLRESRTDLVVAILEYLPAEEKKAAAKGKKKTVVDDIPRRSGRVKFVVPMRSWIGIGPYTISTSMSSSSVSPDARTIISFGPGTHGNLSSRMLKSHALAHSPEFLQLR